MIKVSVIVPVYNVEQYLPQCLDSLVNQTLQDIEIIIVNDGSTDNSQEIINNYIKRYPKKIKNYIKENGGLGSARNYGLKHAIGKYTSFVDSDDWLDLNALELMYKALEKHKSDIAVCDMVDHFLNGEKIYHNCTKYKFKYEKTGSACNKMFKKELIGTLKFHNSIWYEDLNFTTKLLMKTDKIVTISKGLYHCNVREKSIMNNNNSLKNLDIIFCLDDLKEYFIQNKISNWEEVYAYLVFHNILIGAINRVTVQNNADKKNVIHKLKNYCKNNINNYQKYNFYKSEPTNTKIIAKLNYQGLNKLSQKLLLIKQKIKGKV